MKCIPRSRRVLLVLWSSACAYFATAGNRSGKAASRNTAAPPSSLLDRELALLREHRNSQKKRLEYLESELAKVQDEEGVANTGYFSSFFSANNVNHDGRVGVGEEDVAEKSTFLTDDEDHRGRTS